MEQLIFIGIFLLAAVVDLLIRWLRGKTREPESRDDLVILEDTEATDQDEREEAWLERRQVGREPEPPPVMAEPPRSAPPRPAAPPRSAPPRPAAPPRAELPPPPIRAPSLEEVAPRRAVVPPVAVRAARSAPHPPRRARARRWIATPASARQGIIVMTILGRCRGLE